MKIKRFNIFTVIKNIFIDFYESYKSFLFDEVSEEMNITFFLITLLLLSIPTYFVIIHGDPLMFGDDSMLKFMMWLMAFLLSIIEYGVFMIIKNLIVAYIKHYNEKFN